MPKGRLCARDQGCGLLGSKASWHFACRGLELRTEHHARSLGRRCMGDKLQPVCDDVSFRGGTADWGALEAAVLAQPRPIALLARCFSRHAAQVGARSVISLSSSAQRTIFCLFLIFIIHPTGMSHQSIACFSVRLDLPLDLISHPSCKQASHMLCIDASLHFCI